MRIGLDLSVLGEIKANDEVGFGFFGCFQSFEVVVEGFETLLLRLYLFVKNEFGLVRGVEDFPHVVGLVSLLLHLEA